MGIRRRHFLKLMALSGAGMLFPDTPALALSGSSEARKGKVLIGMRESDAQCGLVIFDWDKYSFDHIGKIPLKGVHSLVWSPDQSHLYAFEAFGSCAKMDLKTKEMTTANPDRSKESFAGHALMTTDREHLICTELNKKSKLVVRIRASRDLKIVEQLPELYTGSHHIVQLPGTSIVVFGGQYGPPNDRPGHVTFYDYQKRQVINRIEVDHGLHHFLPLSSKEVIAGSYSDFVDFRKISRALYSHPSTDRVVLRDLFPQNYKPMPIRYYHLDGTTKEMWDANHSELFRYNFALASAGSDKGTFLSTHINSGKIIYWTDFKVNKVIDATSPTIISSSADKSEFLVASEDRLKLYSVKSLSEIPLKDAPKGVLAFTNYA